MNLNPYDLQWCVRRIPTILRKLIKKEELTVAGGYIRSCITNEKINDIDLFIPYKKLGKELALYLVNDNEKRLIETDNAITVKVAKKTVQFITRWTYEQPLDVLASFDYTICQAAFWWDHYCQKWRSACSESFYQDLAAKRLIYTNPVRDEAPGGSMLRILKYYQRGYRITLPSLADVISRLVHGVNLDHGLMDDDTGRIIPEEFSQIIKGLLYEVDPNTDPDHIIE